MSGWVKIHRQILEWEWYDDINTCRLFFHLLIKANHKERNYKGKVVSIGETLTGLDKLSNETNLSVQQIRTSLNKLKSTNEITINSTSQGTVIKIVNYEKYQVATNEPTDEQQTNNKRVTTNKNDKKENNDKETIYRAFGKLKLTDEEFKSLNTDYSKQQIDDVLDQIENYKNNKNYVSLYLTAKNWLKKAYPVREVELTQDQIFYNNVMRQINERNS
jgi:predicted transcriptional regulator